MAQPKSIPPGKGGKPYGKSSKNPSFNKMVRLNRTHYSLLKIYRQNFQFFKIAPSSQSPANYAKFAHFVNLLCFRHHRQRTLQNSSELRKFRAIRPHSPRMTRNSHHYSHYTLRFRCLTSGRERHEILANQAKFARFAPIPREFRTLRTKINTYVIDFQISDHQQRTKENWSESTRFCSIRPLITRIPRISQ